MDPAAQLDVTSRNHRSAAIVDYTEGYPYFLQEYRNVLWNLADASPIIARDVDEARAAVEAKPMAASFVCEQRADRV